MNPSKLQPRTRRTEPLPEFLRVAQVSRLLQASASTVRDLIQNGDLPAVPLNSSRKSRLHYRITRRSFLRYYEKHYGQPFPTEPSL